MPRPHTIPVNAESPGVRFRHQYFLKFPRWFQCANKFENWWLIRLWGNYLTSLSLTLMDIVIKIMYVHKQRISMVTTSLPSTTTTPSNIISGIISFLPAFLFSCLPPSFPFFPLSFLLRYYLHIITFTFFKVWNLVGFSIFTKLCNHHHYIIPKHFHHPKKETSYPKPPKPPPSPWEPLIYFLSLWI